MKIAVIVLPVLIVLAILGAAFGVSNTPAVRFGAPVQAVGAETPVSVVVAAPHGVRHVAAYLEQNGKRWTAFEANKPAQRFVFRGSEPEQTFSFKVGKKTAPELTDGKARVIVEAVSNDMRGASATAASDVTVSLAPPLISADGAQHYVNQGGSELVTFHVSGYWTEAGVRVGKYTFRSFPLPGQPENSPDRFSLFAYPWDLPATEIPVVYARNPSGAEAKATFWFKLFPKSFRKRDLELSDSFLTKVAMELDPNGTGTPLEKFLKINRETRQQNNKYLSDLRLKSEQKILWSGPFYRLGKVESFFADQRSYTYQGKKVDEQMHLGFDLSDVQGAPVKAANSGKIVHAGPLGIYGNCIVVDHGYGLQSIYGHLRQIDVKVGDSVAKVQVMGRSGATGLAGGDHLHYSMQVDGVQVQPIEWWDEHWIKDRVLSKLPATAQTK